MTIDYFERLSRIAGEMNRTRVSPTAQVHYDLLADALVWSDELPCEISGRRGEFDCIKLLWRYRTTMLLGKPDNSFRPYWVRARAIFPNWAGFHFSRLKATEELVEFYRREHDRGIRSLEECVNVDERHDRRPEGGKGV